MAPLLCLGILISVSYSLVFNDESVEIAEVDSIPSLELKPFVSIEGTKYLRANVTTPETRNRSFSSGAQYNPGEVRNIVFLDSETLSQHKLYATNTTVIINTLGYPRTGTATDQYNPSIQGDDTVTQWIVYQVVKEDSNKDGRQNSDDLRTIAISDVSGFNYSELLDGISEVNGMTMVNPGQLIVVYEEGEIYKVSFLDLENRAIIDTEEIVSIDTETQ